MFNLEDANGFLWYVTVTDSGYYQAIPGPLGSTPNVYLNDNAGDSWQLVVTTAGFVQPASVTFNSSYPGGIVLVSPGGLSWLLQVLPGPLLQTTKLGPAMPFLQTTSIGREIEVVGY